MLLYLLFAFTLFINAVLLFSVQPMIAKMILPLLGGTPSVWNTSMLFFQAVLLGGYLYAHTIAAWLSVKQQILLHFILLTAAAALLPFGILQNAAQSLSWDSNPIFWLLRLLFVVVGMPFLVISASAPLLQKWFSGTSHAAANDPYFLYAPSNLGSLVALLGYPLVIEPFFSLHQQSLLWAIVYWGLILFIAVCGIVVWRYSRKIDSKESISDCKLEQNPEVFTIKRRFRWLLLAFIPSSLMLGVTSHLTTDIASMPLLWVIPLSIYLLTFVLVFANHRIFPQWLMPRILPMTALILVFVMLTKIEDPVWFVFGLHLFFFFVAAMVCHGFLADDRPHTQYLTEFYLYISIGGVLGGIFNALIAPVVFDRVVEYPLAIVLACYICHMKNEAPVNAFQQWGDYLLPIILGGATAAMAVFIPHFGLEPYQLWMFIIFGLPLIVCYIFVNRPIRFAVGIGAVMVASTFYSAIYGQTLHTERNFFGTLRVTYDTEGPFHRLYHGTTIHGLQYVDPERHGEALAYYHRQGPFGQIIQAYKDMPASDSVAIVGLGAGSMLAYAAPAQHFTYYEIDPAVVRIARDDRYFTFWKNANPGSLKVVLGDARLRLMEAPDSYYGLIVIDAFSSDAIPMHLLTREALHLYLSKLRDNGFIAIHITSRNLDLTKVIGDLAEDSGIYCLGRNDNAAGGTDAEEKGKYSSHWVVMAQKAETLMPFTQDSRWQKVTGNSVPKPWTDDFSDILSVIKWR